MGRLRRFPDHRYVGRRDLMRVFDCDNDQQLADLSVDADRLGQIGLLQAFAPDTLTEAANRGFRPVQPP